MDREKIAAVEANRRKRGRPRSAEADAAIERGALRQDIDVGLATDILHGSLVYRFLLSGQGIAGLRPSYVRRLIEALLTGFARPERTTSDGARGLGRCPRPSPNGRGNRVIPGT